MNIIERLIEFSSEIYEPPPRRKRHAFIGSVAGIVGGGAAQTGVGLGLLGGVTTSKVQKAGSEADRQIIAGLHEAGKKAGYHVEETELPRFLPAYAHPVTKTVAYSPSIRQYFKPGVIAHEIGHAKDPLLNHPSQIGHALYQGGKQLTGVASLVAGVTGSETNAKRASVAGAVTSLPMLAAETRASVSGIMALRKAGMRGLRSLTPAVGLPSYAAMAAAPGVIYGIKKKLHGYRENS